mmetsp:Transcript_2494/g.5872  ORF Transcript_2494/g.5872 Transcript_2494/m.5872 type:complete len:295 (-) Transcript_2494:1502-2386(-)
MYYMYDMRKRREWHGSKLARNPLSGSSAPPSASFVAHPRTPAPGPCSALRSARDCRAACGACVSSSLRNHIQATAQGCRLPARIWVLASHRPKQSPQGRVLRTRRWWEQASVLDGALRHSLEEKPLERVALAKELAIQPARRLPCLIHPGSPIHDVLAGDERKILAGVLPEELRAHHVLGHGEGGGGVDVRLLYAHHHLVLRVEKLLALLDSLLALVGDGDAWRKARERHRLLQPLQQDRSSSLVLAGLLLAEAHPQIRRSRLIVPAELDLRRILPAAPVVKLLGHAAGVAVHV